MTATNKEANFHSVKTMNVSEAKTHFSSVVDSVEAGATVLICRRNIPVAQIIPVAPENSGKHHRTVIGWAKETGVRILGDITEPALPSSDWQMLR